MAAAEGGLAQLGALPVTLEAPCGVSAAEEPDYELLLAEISKLTSLYKDTRVDWALIIDLGSALLRNKSKDLQVASYLCRALFEQQGYAGLETGLTIYHDLVATYWEGLFPEKRRMRRRLGAITWLVEKLSSAIPQRALTTSEHEAVRHCYALSEQLAAVLKEQCGDQQLDMSLLLRPLRELQASVAPPPQESPKPVSTEAPVPSAPPPPAPATAPTEATRSGVNLPSAIATEAEVNRALLACQTVLRNAATFLLRQNLANPLSYRFLRIGVWLRVSQLPPSQNGVSQIAGVQATSRQHYETALQQGNYADLIPDVEATFSQVLYWFDAHRLTALALTALGHTQAKQAIIDELGHFLRRFPGLLDLKFADGTPYASEATRLWISTEIMAVAPSRSMTAATVSAESPDGQQSPPWLQTTQEAKQLAAKGQLNAGVALFQSGQKQAVSQRERFLWRLQQARFCVEAGLTDVAIPQLEFLQEQLDRYALDEWEPTLSLAVLPLLLRCYRKCCEQAPQPAALLLEKTERLYARLCRLDVTSVLALDGKT